MICLLSRKRAGRRREKKLDLSAGQGVCRQTEGEKARFVYRAGSTLADAGRKSLICLPGRECVGRRRKKKLDLSAGRKACRQTQREKA